MSSTYTRFQQQGFQAQKFVIETIIVQGDFEDDCCEKFANGHLVINGMI